MKKELPPAMIAAILILVVGSVIAIFLFTGNADSQQVDVETLDPVSLRDPDPRADPNRGRPEGQ